jgi:NAD(P)-dependent dehydrogenase (short-subunit alcohol dehydrogenase family)
MGASAMNRVWLITGANSGFGQAITEAAVAAGDIAVATARRVTALDDLAVAHPGQVDALPLDVTDPGAVDATVRDVIGRHGRIDVLVNNAGRTHVGAVEETTDAELRDLFEVHLFGPAALTRAVLPHMRSRQSGAIVQISSMGGQMSFAGFGAYSATKFALEGMSEALADEVRPLGIKVLIVEPGAFRTGLFGHHSASTPIADYAGTVGQTRHMIEAGAGNQPGDPAKAAAAILTALDAPSTPLRLPLGDDAVDALLGHLDSTRADITTWEKLARNTQFPS